MRAAELSEQKSKPPEVARRLRVSRRSAYQWRHLRREGGAEALASRGASGSRCRLSPRCLGKPAVYVEQGPAAHGWVEDQVRTAARVATLIGRKFRFNRMIGQLCHCLRHTELFDGHTAFPSNQSKLLDTLDT
ncbi:hypothetical protein GCM10027162_68050 [Streptomyces incanus]